MSSDGRVVAAEVVVTAPPMVDGISNVELAAAFGADIILLNMVDVFNFGVEGVPESIRSIADLSRFVLRFVGNNLEAVDPGVLPAGRDSLEGNCRGKPGFRVSHDRSNRESGPRGHVEENRSRG
jgi:hypothetical protein